MLFSSSLINNAKNFETVYDSFLSVSAENCQLKRFEIEFGFPLSKEIKFNQMTIKLFNQNINNSTVESILLYGA